MSTFWAQGPPLGSNLRWAPLTKILDPPLHTSAFRLTLQELRFMFKLFCTLPLCLVGFGRWAQARPDRSSGMNTCAAVDMFGEKTSPIRNACDPQFRLSGSVNERSVNQRRADQRSVNQKSVNERSVNQRSVDQRSVNQRRVDQISVNQRRVNHVVRRCCERSGKTQL